MDTKYRIESYQTQHVSWTTGVSPKNITRYRIVRNSDDRVLEIGIKNKKLAEDRASFIA